MIHESLPEIPVFQGLSRTQIEELNHWLLRKEYKRGEAILREGDPPDGLYVVARGSVDALKKTPQGKIVIARLEGPTVLGEMGLLTGEARSASAVACSACVVGHLPIDLFDEQIAANNLTALHIAFNLGRIVSQRMKEALRRIALLTEALTERNMPAEEKASVSRILRAVTTHCLTGVDSGERS